jgi:hypothetical protein
MALASELNGCRNIGAEFECCVPIIGAGDNSSVQDEIASVLRANGLSACSRPYSHAPLPPGCDVAVEHDSSIIGEQRFRGVRWAQVELKTRVLHGLHD